MFSRIIDVALGTIRMIFISKGEKILASTFGFFEVLIWIIAITKLLENLTNFLTYVGYALGFAIGTYVGILMEKKMLVGKVVVRIITHKDSKDFLEELRNKHYTFTSVGVDGPGGLVRSIQTIVDKKHLNTLLTFLTSHDSSAYYTVEDVNIVTEHNSIENLTTLNKNFSKRK